MHSVFPKALGRPMDYFNEYLFHQLLHSLNESRAAAGQPPIDMVWGQTLRNEFSVAALRRMEKLAQGERKRLAAIETTEKRPLSAAEAKRLERYRKPMAFGDIVQANFDEAATEILGKYAPQGWVFCAKPTDEHTADIYKLYVDRFADYTKLGRAAEDAQSSMLPLSPYSPDFAGRDTFGGYGGDLLFARLDDLNAHPHFDEGLQLYVQGDGGQSFDKAGMAWTINDASGIAALRPYMAREEYNELAPWLASGNPEEFMTRAAIERSVAILNELRRSNDGYTVVRGEYQGQLEAKLPDSKMSVRLMDVRTNEHYVGKVYDDGYSYYIRTNIPNRPQGARQGSGHPSESFKDVTADDCVTLLRFAQGKLVTKTVADPQTGKLTQVPIGTPGQYSGVAKGKTVVYNEAYLSSRLFSASIRPHPQYPNFRIMLTVANNHTRVPSAYSKAETAISILQDAVQAARERFTAELNVEYLIAENSKQLHIADGAARSAPVYSADEKVAEIQKRYWNILTGQWAALLLPGVSLQAYFETLPDKVAPSSFPYVEDYCCPGETPEEIVRCHAELNLDAFIGTYEPDEKGLRFDVGNVVRYMSTEENKSGYENSGRVIAALRTLHIGINELRGKDLESVFAKNNMIEFDEASAVPMGDIENPFVKSLFHIIKDTISTTACTIENTDDIQIDKNGVVRYKAMRTSVMKVREDGTFATPITGEIGQIFIPDSNGNVTTCFNSGANFSLAAGCGDSAGADAESETIPTQQGRRRTSYAQIISDRLAYQLRTDLLVERPPLGIPTSLNSIYFHMRREGKEMV